MSYNAEKSTFYQENALFASSPLQVSFGEPPLEFFFQKTLILAFKAHSKSKLSRENETKIVKITHSGRVVNV